MEREIQQLRKQLEQTTLKVNEMLEQRLKQMRQNPPSIGQTQLRANGNSRKYASPTDMKLVWRKGKPAPEAMYRFSHAAVDNTKVYFSADGQRKVYCYNISSDSWTCLPECPNECCSFAVIRNMLTAIGGLEGDRHYSDKVYNLRGRTWVKEFPPMPTARSSSSAVCIRSVLIVAGGFLDQLSKCPVEVMNIESRQWSTAADIPVKEQLVCGSGVISGDQLYVLGGRDSKSVYSCSLSDLLQSYQSVSKSKAAPQLQPNVWRKHADLPFYHSTCVSLCDHLLAIGGSKEKFSPRDDIVSKAVHAYKPTANSWEVISEISIACYNCFAVTLPTTNELMVVGGQSKGINISTDSVEFASLV